MKDDSVKDIRGKGISLQDLVAFQPEAIVSREIIRQKGGSVTAFALAAGQQLSEHTAPFDALVIVIQGKLEITISGNQHHLSAGQMIIMPAHQPHALRAETQAKLLLVMIKA